MRFIDRIRKRLPVNLPRRGVHQLLDFSVYRGVAYHLTSESIRTKSERRVAVREVHIPHASKVADCGNAAKGRLKVGPGCNVAFLEPIDRIGGLDEIKARHLMACRPQRNDHMTSKEARASCYQCPKGFH